MLARRSITPRHARRAIHAGLVGEPIQSAVANLYDAERVQELLAWPEVMAKEGRAACPNGLFIARRFVSVLATREEQLAAAAEDWIIGPMPMVVTVASCCWAPS